MDNMATINARNTRRLKTTQPESRSEGEYEGNE